MQDNLVKKTKAAVPEVVDGAKGGNDGAQSMAADAVNAAAGAISSCVSVMGEFARKLEAAVPKYVDAIAEAGEEALDMVQEELTEIADDISQRNKNILERVKKEWKNYNQNVKRGVTGKRVGYNVITMALDTLDFLLQLRKAVVEEYPIVALQEKMMQSGYQEIKDQIRKSADNEGNRIYNKHWPIISDFVGGLYNASDMEKSQGAAAAAGAFLNGVIVQGLLGTVDGVVSAATDPYGAVEGINNIIREPEVAAAQACMATETIWNEEIVNGSAEDRSRLAGAAVFEIAMTVLTLGAGKAASAGKVAKAAKTGDVASDMGKAAKAAGALDDAGDAAKAAKRAGALGGADNGGGSSRYYNNLVKKNNAPAGTSGVKIKKGGGGNAGPGAWEKTNEAMSAHSREYQKFVTGAEDGMVYRVNGVKFDGFQDGVLMEAKGNYSNFVDKKTGKFRSWFSGKDSLVEQANRQINAADGTKIQWYFSDEASLNATKTLFKSEGITEIELVYKPMQ